MTPRQQLLRWWGWMCIGTAALMCLIALRYFASADLESSVSVLLFRAAMFVAHFGLVALLLLLPALLLLVLVPRPVVVLPVGIALAVLSTTLLLVDTQVYELYRFHINAGVLNLLFGGAASETFFFSPVMYAQALLVFAVVVAAFVALGLWTWRQVRRHPGSRRTRRVLVGGFIAAIFAFHLTHIWADAMAYEPIVAQTEVLPLRYAATAKRTLRKFGFETRRPHSLQARSADDRTGLSYPLAPLECQRPQQPPNLVVIMIDSWRFDAMNAAVTPNIAEFAKQSVQFMEHYSGGNATRIGVFSFFYAIPGTYWHRVLAEQRRPVFVDQLLAAGYDLRVFRSAPLYSPEFDRTIFAGLPNLRMRSAGNRPADWDRDLTTDFLQFLEQRTSDQPFFSFLFYDAPHSFDLPPGHKGPFQPSVDVVNYLVLHKTEDPTPFLNRYKNSVHYVDSLVGEALEGLRERGLLDNTVVIITGDHGQEFNDTGLGYWGHNSTYARYQVGVPFMVYAPDLEPATFHHRTSHFDVVPTLLRRYLGCTTAAENYSVGRSLFEPGGRETLVMSEYSDFAIVQPNVITVVREHGIDVRSPDYARLDDEQISPQAIADALEQNGRFYKGVHVGRRKD